MKRFLVLGFVSMCLCSCGLFETHSVARGATAGGAGAAAIGAGTGALVGSLMTAGDVTASALLGAGIGLPVGAVLGAAYIQNKNEAELKKHQAVIDENHDVIVQRERELMELRQQAEFDSYTIQVDPSLQDDLYLGPSLGNYLR